MTSIQKAKEIIISYLKNVVGIVDPKKVDKYLASPEAAALLSGEDWKEDGWISVEDRLPESGELVLWYKEDGIIFIETIANNPWILERRTTERTLPSVTHWQSLPQPPTHNAV